jgi:hypothetical protein
MVLESKHYLVQSFQRRTAESIETKYFSFHNYNPITV